MRPFPATTPSSVLLEALGGELVPDSVATASGRGYRAREVSEPRAPADGGPGADQPAAPRISGLQGLPGSEDFRAPRASGRRGLPGSRARRWTTVVRHLRKSPRSPSRRLSAMGRSRHIQNDSDSVTAGRGSSGSRHEGTCPPTEENSSPEKRPAPLKHRGAAADVAGREPSLSDL